MISRGFIYAASSYFLWGLLPLYWRLLANINSMHILAFRIILSLILCIGILLVQKNISWLSFYKDKKKFLFLLVSGFTICFSWGIYIWAVNKGNTIQASLGYYITPLISIVLGMYFFGEKMKRLQVAAFILAFSGVLILTIHSGSLPWISLGLAFSFALYGLIKKKINMPALETLAVETLVVFPFSLLLLFTPLASVLDSGYPGQEGLFYLTDLPLITLLLLCLAGAATTLPLYLFSKGAKLLPLSTLGFIQFLSPTMTFMTGIFIFQEPFPMIYFIVFGFIWSAVILYIISHRKSSPKNINV